MKAICAVLLSLAIAFLNSSRAAMPAPERLPEAAKPELAGPDDVLRQYLKAVDRGELEIFGHRLSRAMIVPVRVEYVFQLSSRAIRVLVYSTLRERIPIPGCRDCRVHGVSAVLEDGHIVDLESHIRLNE